MRISGSQSGGPGSIPGNRTTGAWTVGGQGALGQTRGVGPKGGTGAGGREGDQGGPGGPWGDHGGAMDHCGAMGDIEGGHRVPGGSRGEHRVEPPCDPPRGVRGRMGLLSSIGRNKAFCRIQCHLLSRVTLC